MELELLELFTCTQQQQPASEQDKESELRTMSCACVHTVRYREPLRVEVSASVPSQGALIPVDQSVVK